MHPQRQSVALYRRIAVSFIIFTLVLIIVVIYLSFSEAEIVVYPEEETASTNFITDVKILSGEVFEETFTRSLKQFTTGEGFIDSDTLGSVTIYNNYSVKQPLVEKTRLLTPDGQLFRIKKTVTVPAGGKIEGIEIRADDPSSLKLPIEAGLRLTIPGLYSGIQDKIYAETNTAIEATSRKVKVVSNDDIKSAQMQLEKNIEEEAQAQFESKLSAEGKPMKVEITKLEVLATTADGKISDERDEFEMTMNARVVVIAFDREVLKNLAKEKLSEKVTDASELELMDIGNFTFQLANYDSKAGTAEIQVYLEGKTQLRLASPILDKKNFTGKTKKEVVAFLTESPVIEDVEVTLKPFWLTRIPKLLDHIDIVIKRVGEPDT